MIGALQIAIGGLVQGCVFAVIALGFSLVYRVTGVVNLAHIAHKVSKSDIGIRENYTDEYFYLKNGEKIGWIVFTSMHIIHLAKKPTPCCVRPQW